MWWLRGLDMTKGFARKEICVGTLAGIHVAME